MRKSPRSSWFGVVALVLAAGSALSAHRHDEYLQAARLAIDPDRVEIALDLTPGIVVADQVPGGTCGVSVSGRSPALLGPLKPAGAASIERPCNPGV